MQAWKLVRWMREARAHSAQIRTPSTGGGRYWCGFTHRDMVDLIYVRPCHWHSAESMALAICRSFLSFQAEQGSLPDGRLLEGDGTVGRWYRGERL